MLLGGGAFGHPGKRLNGRQDRFQGIPHKLVRVISWHSAIRRLKRSLAPASFTPGAVVFGYFRDYLESFGLLLVHLGHFLFIDHVVEGQRQHDVESLFRSHDAAPSNGTARTERHSR